MKSPTVEAAPPQMPLSSRPGYCGQTDFGGNCSHGSLGAWPDVSSLRACTTLCRSCDRCRFVSFSLKFGDCSWYTTCGQVLLEVPHNPPGSGRHYTTVEVKSASAAPSGQGCQQQLKALWEGAATHRDTGIGGLCPRQMRRAPGNPTVVVSSVDMLGWARAESSAFANTVLEHPLGSPLWIYHEASWQLANNRSQVAAPRARAAVSCFIDLFEALPPLFALITSSNSCVDAFYRIAGRHEPEESELRVQTAKVSVRLIGAMYHAALSLPRRASFLWADFDAVPLKPLDDAFWSFVRSYDISYAPFVDIPHIPTRVWRLDRMTARGAMIKRLIKQSDPTWRVSPDLLGFSVGRRSRALLEAMLRHFDGDGVWLTRHCLCQQAGVSSFPCAREWFAENLYFGGTYVWSLHLHWAALRQHPELAELKQGWFAAGNGMPHVGGWDCHLSPNSETQQAACTGAAPFVSPFSIRDRFEHRFNTGPFATTYSNWASHRGGSVGIIWPELRMPESTHGGWLHERVAARQGREGGGDDGRGIELTTELDGCQVALPTPEWRPNPNFSYGERLSAG